MHIRAERQAPARALWPRHPHIVEGDDFLDMESFYEKDPLSTIREDSAIVDTRYEHILSRDLRDAGV